MAEVLSLLKLRNYMCGGFDFGKEWSIRFGRRLGIKCYAIVSGECWLSVEGEPDPVQLRAGDAFLLPNGQPFVLSSNLSLEPVDACTKLSLPVQGSIRILDGGGGCLGIGGHFTMDGEHASHLLGALPPIIHLRKESEKAAMRSCIRMLMEELHEPQPGGLLMAQHLAQMLLVQALRLHLADGASSGVGWLFALSDPQMRAAIHGMHENPEEAWTLQKLSARAGMSRSIFALKFKQTVGHAPLEYLTRWRMLLAGDRLANSNASVSSIARSLGYESEAAFSTAFKRVMGSSPRQYGRARSNTPAESVEA